MFVGLMVTLAVAVSFLVWVVLRLNRIYNQLNLYSDHVKSVKKGVRQAVLSEDFLNVLRNHAQLELDTTLQNIHLEVEDKLSATYETLSTSIKESAAAILHRELNEYQTAIAQARQTALSVASEAQNLLMESRATVEAQAKAEIAAEKQALLIKLDTKLEDIINSYLLEALGKEVDLGAQSRYIMRQLAEHKQDIKREINEEF